MFLRWKWVQIGKRTASPSSLNYFALKIVKIFFSVIESFIKTEKNIVIIIGESTKTLIVNFKKNI